MFSSSALIMQAKQMVVENSAAILTGTGVVGTVTTAVLAGKAGYSSAFVIQDRERALAEAANELTPESITVEQESAAEAISLKEKVYLIGPLFLPAIGAGITTITAIIFSYRISSSQSAALAAAYGMSEKALQEYKDKVAEKVTPKKQGEIKDAIAEEYVKKNPPPSVLVVGEGEVRVLDSWSGIYFKSTVEKIRRAENAVNAEIIQHSHANLGQFYDELELDKPEMAGEFGWNTGSMVDLHISTTMDDTEKPIVIISHNNAPKADYEKEYMA